MSCCGSLIKCMFIVSNIIFLLIGLAIFTLGGILKWSKDTIFGLFNSDEIKTFIDLSVVDIVAIVLLVIGAFIIVLSICGLIGASCNNRVFLVVYEIIIILLFMAHLVTLIVGVVKIDDIEKLYRRTLNSTMQNLNDQAFITNQTVQAVQFCAAFNILSQTFKCCGVNGPSDFLLDPFKSGKCCSGDTFTGNTGCADKSWNTLKDGVVYYIIIPNSFILGFEFLIVVIVPILIKRISNKR